MIGKFMWAIALVLILLLVGISIYLYFFIKGIIENLRREINQLEKMVLSVVSFCLSVACVNIFSTYTIIVLHIVFVGALVDLVYIILHKALKNCREKKAYKVWSKIYGLRIIPVIITSILMTYGYFNMMNVLPVSYEIETDKVFTVEEDGSYRVVFISDLHYGVSIDNDELTRICEEISAKDVDIVILGGDLTDESTTKQQMQDAFRILGEIKSKYGIFYVYGNHDIQSYSDTKTFTEEEHKQILETEGIKILKDEVYTINDEFHIIGRLDASFKRKTNSERKSIEELVNGIDKSDYILVADHQPVEYELNKSAGVDLLISGHTHNGQIWPAGFFIQFMNDGVYGLERDEDGFKAIVSSGIAGWGYAVKTSAPAEYVIVDIK